MGYVHFELPDRLVQEAKAAGLSIPALAEQALLGALSGSNPLASSTEPHTRRGLGDDISRYRRGFDLGERWAAGRGSVEELTEMAEFASWRWQDLPLASATHSLVDLLVEAGEVDRADERTAWLSRDAFSEGLVDAVAAAVSP